jgi:NADPH-dependent 2,4-dienoyl-CoA reductase/sulfur reductase-like enzyme
VVGGSAGIIGCPALTRHRLLGGAYLPLGTTAYKQGRVAGENAAGRIREFAGSLGT